uniref:Cadherin 18 n=1 Tax=Sphaeramia orbicularis TaxID=375764 RepID=A0A673CZ92_9TELE
MRISTTSCLCPFLVCLCFIQRCYGASHHVPAKVPSKNQTKLANGETEVHHRPKRGWIWNQFFVLEEHMGPDAQYVGKLHSNSDKGDGSVRYILSGEGAGTIFIIDEVTGDIHATKSLDRERKTHYVLHAQALDRNTEEALEPKSEFIIKVQDINDNAPKFPDGPFVASVPEMSELGTSVLQVTATDADDPTYGNSARIVYSILQGQPYFSVDPKTGIIRTALANMDREAREHYTVVIQAKDMAGQVGGLSGSTTINITLTDVNDNPPKFPQKNYELYVVESAQVGKPVGKIKANDEDLGINADIKYSIINSEGANMFSISTDRDTREGIISLKRKKTYTLPHRGNEYTRRSSLFLSRSFKDTATLKISVGDVDEPPVFSMDYYIMDVYENSPGGTEVGAVTARDPDSNNTHIYKHTHLHTCICIHIHTYMYTYTHTLYCTMSSYFALARIGLFQREIWFDESRLTLFQTEKRLPIMPSAYSISLWGQCSDLGLIQLVKSRSSNVVCPKKWTHVLNGQVGTSVDFSLQMILAYSNMTKLELKVFQSVSKSVRLHFYIWIGLLIDQT